MVSPQVGFAMSPRSGRREDAEQRLKERDAQTPTITGTTYRSFYQNNPVRFDYGLTKKGAELLPVLQAISRLANAHLPETCKAPANFLALKPNEIAVKVPSRAR